MFSVWKDGWKVFFRVFIFQIIAQLLFLPLALFFSFFKSLDGKDPIAAFLVGLIILLLTMPFVYYAASEFSGEFVGPKVTRKKLRQIKQTARNMNLSS